MIDGRRRAESRAGSRLGGQMGSKRRPLGRSYSGDGRPSAYGPPGPGSDGEDNWPLVEYRPERRNYLLSVRPENRSVLGARGGRAGGRAPRRASERMQSAAGAAPPGR